MRGVRRISEAKLLDALGRARNVSEAAKLAGCSRPTLYRRAEESPAIAAALEDFRSRRQVRGARTPTPDKRDPKGAPAERPTEQVRADPDFEAKLRRLGLATLAQIAEGKDGSAKAADRVTAARYLVQLTGRAPASPARDADAPAPPRAEQPLTAEQVAAALRVKRA